MKIQDIITTFKGKTFSSNEEVVEWLESSLTSLLDSIEKELPKESSNNGSVYGYDLGANKYRQEVINIINSHR